MRGWIFFSLFLESIVILDQTAMVAGQLSLEEFLMQYQMQLSNCQTSECVDEIYQSIQGIRISLARPDPKDSDKSTAAAPKGCEKVTSQHEKDNSKLRSNLNTTASRCEEQSTAQQTQNQSFYNFEQCGLFPGCYLHPHQNESWKLKCEKSVVNLIASISVLLSAIVTFSNILIITITVRTKNLRKPHGYFKLSLASADLIAGLFVLPSIVHNILFKIDYENTVYQSVDLPDSVVYTDKASIGTGAARFFGVMSILSTITAVYSLLLLSADRFLAVKCPLKYKTMMTSKRSRILLGVIWAISLFVGFAPILAEDLVSYGMSPFTFKFNLVVKPIPNIPEDSSAILRYCHAFVYSVIVWGLPFVITWVLTLWTFIRSVTMGRRMKGSKINGSIKKGKRNETFTREDRQLVRTVVVILSLFTITVLPEFAAALATLYVPPGECYDSSYVWFFFLSTYVLIGGRFLNVIVYNVLNKEFREASKKFFTLLLNIILRRKSKAMQGLPKRSLSSRKSWSIGSSIKRRKSSSSSSKSYSRDTETSNSSLRSKLSLKKSISNNFKKHNNKNNFQGKINPVCVCNNICER